MALNNVPNVIYDSDKALIVVRLGFVKIAHISYSAALYLWVIDISG